jgi:DoxX-like family
MNSTNDPIVTHKSASKSQTAPVSKGRFWASWVLAGLPAVFLLFDAVMKLAKPPFVVQATVQLGYPETVIVGLGIVLMTCTILYLIPRTAVLGAILLTGYLGGAVATQVRVGNPLFTHALFPIYLAVFLWGGLFVREGRLRSLIPLRN